MMTVGSLAVLFAELVSPGAETVAIFVKLPATFTLTIRVMVLLVLGASGPGLVQVTVWPTAEQVQPLPVPETKLKPVGSVSVTVIVPMVLAEPMFVAVTVYVPFTPIVKFPLWLFVIARSKPVAPTMVVGSLAVLFAGLVSPEFETVAIFVTPPAIFTPTVRVMLLLALIASGPGLVQVTVWPTAEQDHPLPMPETKLKPVGSVSVTVIVPDALAEPTLVTVIA